LFVIALPPGRHEAAPAREPVPPPPLAEVEKKMPPLRLTTIEAVFESYGQFASWNGDVTEVAMFDPDTKDFTDCYQVIRSSGGTYYFRSIPRLTLPLLTHGVPAGSPLRFTETPAQREQWLKESVDENWNALKGSAPAKTGQK
jgi:hypothetical protein